MKFKAPRGTYDVLPEDSPVWQYIEKTARETFALYNYREIRTPIFESTELFARSIGSTTDIVTKEMYTFLDKKGRSLTLRPEETAPVVRACLENNLISPDKVTKLYYIGPMFRYERPQAGRFRQFSQIGVEAFGSADPALDVEVMTLAVRLFEKLGLKGLEVNVNSVGCSKCRPAFLEELKKYFRSEIGRMCGECGKRLEFNPLRILDCKNEACQGLILKAPAPLDFACADCRRSFEDAMKFLERAKIKCRINDRLVRGLDYYTGLTFEVVSKKLGAQNAVCGGGRYNDLVSDLGGKAVPAVGFALGVERAIDVLKSSNVSVPEAKLDAFVITIGEEAGELGVRISEDLRACGLSADLDFFEKGVKAKMKAADRSGARFAVIVGGEEIKKKSATLKNMKDGSQKEVKLSELVKEIKRK